MSDDFHKLRGVAIPAIWATPSQKEAILPRGFAGIAGIATPRDFHITFLERSAIIEFDGGETRAEANRAALEDILPTIPTEQLVSFIKAGKWSPAELAQIINHMSERET